MVYTTEIETVEKNQALLNDIKSLSLEAMMLKAKGLNARSDIDAYKLCLFEIEHKAGQLGQVL